MSLSIKYKSSVVTQRTMKSCMIASEGLPDDLLATVWKLSTSPAVYLIPKNVKTYSTKYLHYK